MNRRFKAVEFKAPSPLARTFQFAQSLESGEFIQSVENPAEHQDHRPTDEQQQQHDAKHEAASTAAPQQQQGESQHCDHCEASPGAGASPASNEHHENVDHHQQQQQQQQHHEAKEEATPLDAPTHAEPHHHQQQQRFDAHELPPPSPASQSNEAEKRVAVEPMLVTLAGVRAQEFIELERHYRAQLEEALAHKEREFAERLQVERAKMQEEVRDGMLRRTTRWLYSRTRLAASLSLFVV